jgi:nitrile hydratase accessory protein
VSAAPVPARETVEPVFAAPWEAQAFALAVALQERGLVTPGEWAAALGAEVERDPQAPCYRQWLAALEAVVDRKGLADRATLERCRTAGAQAAERTPHGRPVEPDFAP